MGASPPAAPAIPDSPGHFGRLGGTFVPETLMGAESPGNDIGEAATRRAFLRRVGGWHTASPAAILPAMNSSRNPDPDRFPQACPGNVARLAAIGLALLGSSCVGPGQAGDLNPQALQRRERLLGGPPRPLAAGEPARPGGVRAATPTAAAPGRPTRSTAAPRASGRWPPWWPHRTDCSGSMSGSARRSASGAATGNARTSRSAN